MQDFENPLEHWSDPPESDEKERPGERRRSGIEGLADDLVGEVLAWMEDADDPAIAIDPLASERTLRSYEAFVEMTQAKAAADATSNTDAQKDGDDDEPGEAAGAKRIRASYDTCFLRRLHGDDLMGALWPRLEQVYFRIGRREDKAASYVIS